MPFDYTIFHRFRKALSREANVETFINQRLDEIDATLRNTFISGLRLEWVSASSVRVKTGGAWVGGTAAPGVLWVTADITVAGIALGASTWGHVYLYKHASTGAATVEVVTTAPALVLGSAYQKTGDATRRYLGSVRTDSGGNILNFIHLPGDIVNYRVSSSATLRALNAGNATVETTIALTSYVPVTSRAAYLRVVNTASNTSAVFGSSDDSVTIPAGGGVREISAANEKDIILPLNTSQQMTYSFQIGPVGGAAYVEVGGYIFER